MTHHRPRQALCNPRSSMPDLPAQMFAEAIERHRAGEAAQAEALYRALLSLNAGYAQASYNLGLLLQGQRRLDESLLAYRQAIATDPAYYDAYCNMGVALQDLGRFDEALAVYDTVLALKPDFAMAQCNLGVTLRSLGRLDEAVAAYAAAIRIKPDYDWAYANLAAVLMDLGDAVGAVAACEAAVAISPGMATAFFNLGTAHKALCRLPASVAALRQAIMLRPDFAEAHFTLAQVLLLRGDLASGWDEYEWRWKLADYAWLRQAYGDFVQPRWDGEVLTGKTIFVYAEQGLGDAVQFARYIPILVARAGHVVLAVHPPLRRLFATLEGVTVIGLGDPALPSFDVHCPLLSLPRLLGTTLQSIPGNFPYLQSTADDVARWMPRLGGGGDSPGNAPELRVGIVWAGNPTQTGDRLRSPRLSVVRRLFELSGVRFFCLQLGPGRADLDGNPLPGDVVDLGPDIHDFTDTAAIMQGLDLVITSCTSPLHLAGAMGIPTWAMIPFSPHFPWLLERRDSVWYPSVRLYRQARPGTDWSGVVEEIAGDLRALCHDRCGVQAEKPSA